MSSKKTAPPLGDTSPAEKLAAVDARILAAAKAAGRRRTDVTLVAISKTKPVEQITAFLNMGVRHFGENRVQEAAEKWPGLKTKHSDVELHLVGPLQTNKVEQAIGLFDVIETLDRPKLAGALARAGQKLGALPALYIQVNTGEEPQKAGIAPSQLEAFAAQCRNEFDLPILGLMCLPPADQPAAEHFAVLGDLAARIGVAKLSMGMSGDFETAIAHGATHIRLGTQLFGARDGKIVTPSP